MDLYKCFDWEIEAIREAKISKINLDLHKAVKKLGINPKILRSDEEIKKIRESMTIKEEDKPNIFKKLFEVLVCLAIISVSIRIFTNYKNLNMDSFLLGAFVVLVCCIVNKLIEG